MVRVGLAVAAVLWLLAATEAEVYDVTTIYRFDRPGADPLSFRDVVPHFDVQEYHGCHNSCRQNRRRRQWFTFDNLNNGGRVLHTEDSSSCESQPCPWDSEGWNPMNRTLRGFDEVLGLERYDGKGVLETRLQLPPGLTAVCFTLEYYITPRTDARIDVIMVNNEEEISVGTVTALDEELPNDWIKHRFIGEINAGDISLKIVSRTSRENIFIRNIKGCNEAEIVNTTINRAGSTEIHARNNALGLPFVHKGFVHYPNTEADVEACTGLNCTWKATNFILSSRLPLSWEHADYIDARASSRFIRFHGNIDLSFVTPNATGNLYIYLADKEYFQNSNVYVIKIRNFNNDNADDYYDDDDDHSEQSHQLLKCHKVEHQRCCYNNEKIPGVDTSPTFDCNTLDSRKPDKLPFSKNVLHIINVRQDNGKLEVAVQDGKNRDVLLSFEDSYPVRCTHFNAALEAMDGELVAGEFRSWTAEQEMGSLVSPPFVPLQNKVCVAVTCTGALKLNLLQSDEVVEFSSVQRNFLDSTWRTEVFLADITDEPKNPVSIQLIAQDEDLQVALIIGCNGQELEDVHVLSSSSESPYNIEYQASDVAFYKTSSNNGGTEKCINGGIYDYYNRKGCVCPPGFSGDICEKGCGPNSYGSDCKGRCSMSTRGCKGMVLCRPKLGCNCAPGLKGILCDRSCVAGQYGAGCKQLCGNCNSDTCDPYTGECPSGCQDGFYPPLCQQTYRYLTQAPRVISRDFKTLQINFTTDENYLEGAGSLHFYQIQVKSKDDVAWTELVPRLLPADVVVVSNITGLEPGTNYTVRVLLLDEDATTYQGPNVPVALFDTKCTVPSVVKYKFHSSDITTGEFRVSFNYTREHNTWCKATHYEVEMLKNLRWIQQYKGLTESYQFTELLPGEKYNVRVRVVTTDGPAPFSDVLSVTTLSGAPDKVFKLHLVTSRPRTLEIKWDKPLFTGGDIHRYKVSYKCLKLLACSQHDCSYSTGMIEVTSTSAVLHNLLPYAQYHIQVSAMSASWGPTSRLLAVTAMTEPEVSPEPSSTSAVTHQTNSSMEVHWEPPQNCSSLHGFLYGYQYELLGHNVSLIGSTDLTMMTFDDLSPHTPYTVRVFAVTSGGWNAQYPLVIPAKTTATVPSPVQQLTVYKRGRRKLGMRWAAPKETYGALKSFKISYKLEGHKPVSAVINPTSCVAWPHMYCHTLQPLQSDTVYTVQVQARNKEISEDGESASVDAVTKESAPLAPSFIRVLSQTETNLTVQWGIPEMLNGQLRSFLVNVEETDSVNSTDCCQYFPIQEVAVQSEQPDYRIQVSSLRAASTYTISIAAKTVSLGPAMTITAHTQPPVPSMTNLISIPHDSDHLSSQSTIVIHPSTENVELVKGYLLLVLPQSTTKKTSEIWDDRLAQELDQHVNSSYYIAAEFKGDLEETSEVVVGAGTEMMTGKWAQVQNPALEAGATYRFGLVLLLEYCGVFRIGYTETQSFEV